MNKVKIIYKTLRIYGSLMRKLLTKEVSLITTDILRNF